MSNLNGIITTDCTTAHLAGALGCTTMIMLPRSADWRWRNEGGACPWYPSVQLYRQRRSGEWTDVVADIARALLVLNGQR